VFYYNTVYRERERESERERERERERESERERERGANNNCPTGCQPATRIPPQHSHTETPTHIETRTHDQCGDSIEKSQAPDDGCINVRNMLNIEEVK
jgi:hypothetical protein